MEGFAEVQGIGDVDALLTEHAERYSFQIRSRERGRDAVDLIADRIDGALDEQRILDVGCAYGSFAIEFAMRGATAVGVDVSDKWLKLAELNARDDANVTFYKCDASARNAIGTLSPHAPFDVVVLNDVLEHIYDTVGLFQNLRSLASKGGLIYYKIPNGMATRAVLSEGHKKVFGISLLPPDYWGWFVKAPFSIYYRRWQYFTSLFDCFEFVQTESLNPIRDESIEKTKEIIREDINNIRSRLTLKHFDEKRQFYAVRRACNVYIEEVEEDLETLSWEELFHKYRVTFWEGFLKVA